MFVAVILRIFFKKINPKTTKLLSCAIFPLLLRNIPKKAEIGEINIPSISIRDSFLVNRRFRSLKNRIERKEKTAFLFTTPPPPPISGDGVSGGNWPISQTYFLGKAEFLDS